MVLSNVIRWLTILFHLLFILTIGVSAGYCIGSISFDGRFNFSLYKFDNVAFYICESVLSILGIVCLPFSFRSLQRIFIASYESDIQFTTAQPDVVNQQVQQYVAGSSLVLNVEAKRYYIKYYGGVNAGWVQKDLCCPLLPTTMIIGYIALMLECLIVIVILSRDSEVDSYGCQPIDFAEYVGTVAGLNLCYLLSITTIFHCSYAFNLNTIRITGGYVMIFYIIGVSLNHFVAGTGTWNVSKSQSKFTIVVAAIGFVLELVFPLWYIHISYIAIWWQYFVVEEAATLSFEEKQGLSANPSTQADVTNQLQQE